MLSSMLVGIMQATLVLLVAQLWFRIPFAGSFFTLYAGLTVFLLAAVGIGLLLSSVAATMQQAMLFSFMHKTCRITHPSVAITMFSVTHFGKQHW